MFLYAFVFLVAAFLSLWIRRESKIWGPLLGCSFLFGLIPGNIEGVGIIFLGALFVLWVSYDQKPTLLLFLLIIVLSACLKMRLLPGYRPFFFTPNFAIGLEGPFIGFFPLALIVPLAKKRKDWWAAAKGIGIGCLGIAILAVLAILSGAIEWEFKIPSFMGARILSNLFLTSIPEEGFYRGFIQRALCQHLKTIKFGNSIALALTTAFFTVAHIYWSPDPKILAFVFLAGLLYGGVYLVSRKIESAIFSHFLLNFLHMTFFSYHAM